MTDIRDLIGNASAFPILKDWTFFNHAGVSPIPHVCAQAMRKFAAEAEAGAYLNTSWYGDIERLRILAGQLIGAQKDEIAFVKNTSEGISIVAHGLEWQWGDRIVTTAVEYPANIYPWMEIVRSRGVKLVMVPEEADEQGRRVVPVDKILKEAEHERAKLITLSHVEFASGQRHALERIGNFCRERHKLFCVDGIQTMGALPVNVGQMKIDFLSADGHKWMLGPEGAGIFFCRRELIERVRPVLIGWMNVINAQEYGTYDYTLRSDAGRFECGSHNLPGLLGLKASLEMIAAVGTDAIANRIKTLTDRLVDGLTARGYAVLSPRGLGQWSGSVAFASGVHDHAALVRKLRKEKRIEIALREGRLRASPHFYNTESQIDHLLESLPAH